MKFSEELKVSYVTNSSVSKEMIFRHNGHERFLVNRSRAEFKLYRIDEKFGSLQKGNS